MKEYEPPEVQLQLNALADGELDRQASEALLGEIEDNACLRTDLCDIHRVKDMMHYAFADAQPPEKIHPVKLHSRMTLAIAASLLLVVGGMLGTLVGGFDTVSPVLPFNLAQVRQQPQKVVLYVGFSDQKKFADALHKAQFLMENYASQDVQVNIVTSAGGVDMLRQKISPYTDRIRDLAAKYSALSFVACNNTLARLEAQGKSTELIDEAVVAPSAVQFVVGRLEEGWSYVPI